MPDTKPEQDRQAAPAADSIFYMPDGEIDPASRLRNFPYERMGAKTSDATLDPDRATRMIDNRIDRMLAVQKARAEEIKADLRPYAELHEAGREVQSQLVSVRRLFRGYYGAEMAYRIIAGEGPIAKTSQASLLRSQGAFVIEQLWEVELVSLERLPGGCDINVFALLDGLEGAVTWLEQAQSDVARQRHRLHSILEKRARYRRDFDAEYREVVRFAARLCRLAGHPDVADEIEVDCLEGLSS